MGSGAIEHREKRFSFRAFVPMGLGAGFIPGSFRGSEIIIFLRIIGAVVSGISEVFGKTFNRIRLQGTAAHIHRSQTAGIHTNDDTGATWRAYAIDGKCPGIADALCGKLVDIWGDGKLLTVTAQT